MSTITPTSRNRKGFSLILSLTMMAMIVLVVVVLAAFLNVESRAAATFHLATRARLNALMSGRLALAHLQQTAGPDRRSTATGDIYQIPADDDKDYPRPKDFFAPSYIFSPPIAYGPTTNSTEKYSQGQRNWTGVWRTDRPNDPPAWLISGKGGKDLTQNDTYLKSNPILVQSISLYAKTTPRDDTKLDYESGQWAPWHTDYPSSPLGPTLMAVLVGNGSVATIDQTIALPKIPFPDAASISKPTGPVTTSGFFAYWIGDEGVKARINLRDLRDLSGTAPTSTDVINALRSPGRLGTELLTGLTNVAANQAELNQVTSAQQLASNLIPGYQDTTLGLDSRKLSFHNQTLWSAGVLADSFRGGLKRDLSLAFEMDDSEFDTSEFGTGAATNSGSVTESYTVASVNQTDLDQKRHGSVFLDYTGAKNPICTFGLASDVDPRPRIWVPIYENNSSNPLRNLGTTGTEYLAWSPVFIREDEMGQTVNALSDTVKNKPITTLSEKPVGTERRLVGPLWHLVRDYYRLYKDIDWKGNNPQIDTRSFYPNTNQFLSGKYRVHPYARFDLDNAYWNNGGGTNPTGPNYIDSYGATPDPMGWLNPKKGRDVTGTLNGYIPRAVRGAYMPTIHRFTMIFSLKTIKITGTDKYTLKLFCTPIVVLHNPFNIKLNLKSANVVEPDTRCVGGAARLGFSQFDQMQFKVSSHQPYNTTTTPQSLVRVMNVDTLFNFKAYTGDTGANAENLAAIIPAGTLEPGEFAIYSPDDTPVDASTIIKSADLANIPVIKLKKGFFWKGGFYTDVRTASTVPPLEYASTDMIEAQVNLSSSFYWHHWLFINSGWKKNISGDLVNNDGEDLGFDEVIGTSRNNNKSSYAHYINVGGGSANWTAFLGDAGYLGVNNSTYTPPVSGTPPKGILIGPVSAIRTIDNSGAGPVIGVFDTRMRLADTVRNTPYDRTKISWANAEKNGVPAAHPVWIFTNPLAQTSSNPSISGLHGVGMSSQRTQLFGGDQLILNNTPGPSSLSSVLQTSPTGGALGGYTHNVDGASQSIEVEIPLTPPISIGQLMHANLSVWDWFPYRTIGNSFPSVVVPLDKSWTHGTPNTSLGNGGNTFPDMSYLMNNALWDNFFFSGAAPTLAVSKSGNYNKVRTQSTQEVLNKFALGPPNFLANPRMRLYQPKGLDDAFLAFSSDGFFKPSTTGAAVTGYKRISSYLLNDGAFNVNSTSVEAWTALYASLKSLKMDTNPSGTTPIVRIIGADGKNISVKDIQNSEYWKGFVNLSDDDIKALAIATVWEIRARTKFFYRTERDQEYAPTSRRFGTNANFAATPTRYPSTPFLGINEFINRFLGPTKKPGALVSTGTSNTSYYSLPNSLVTDGGNTGKDFSTYVSYPSGLDVTNKLWMLRSGTIESAIARADNGVYGVKPTSSEKYTTQLATVKSGLTDLIDPSTSHNWNNGGVASGLSGMPGGVFWRNIEILNPDTNDNRTHKGFGANGCLFQGDLLQSIGSMLVSRSDTFKIRAYGDAESSPGNNVSCVLELVVQRTPDYINESMKPYERIEDINYGAEKNLTARGASKPVNNILGRRFVIISARWLSKSEI